MPHISLRVPHRAPLLFLALIVFVACKAQDANNQNIVATIAGDYAISFPELQKYVSYYNYDLIYKKDKAKAYDLGMNDMVRNSLKIVDFFDRGLNNNKELLQSIGRTINEEIVAQYFHTQFYAKYVNEKSARDVYAHMGREVLYQQVVLIKPAHASSKDVDSVKKLANDIRTKVSNGMNFSELARKYSQDTASSVEGGRMPAVNWKASLSNNFDYAIFDLAVGAVRIVDNGQSIHVVKVTRVNTIDVPPYERVKDDIVETLGKRYMDLCAQEFDSTKKNLVDERTLKWNKKGLKRLVRWSNIPNFYRLYYSDTLRYAISHGDNFLILKHSRGTVDLKEYLRLTDEVLAFGKFASVNEDDIKKYLLEAVRTNIIVHRATELNLERGIFDRKTTNPVVRSGIVRLYNQQVIDAQIPEATEEALRAFYQANKDLLFYQLAKVNIYAIVDSNKDTITQLQRRLAQNIPFEKLAAIVLVKTFVRQRDGTINSYLSNEAPLLGQAAFTLKPHEISGPIEYTDPEKGKQYAVLQCVASREEKQLSYADVKKTIGDDFAAYYRDKIGKEVEEQLKRRYAIRIYTDVLERNLSAMGIRAQDQTK